MSSFLDACGAIGPLQWAVECRGSDAVGRLAFDLPFLVVGRDPACDLHLRHPEVGDRHAYLQLVGGRLFCLDLGSRTGTYLDGRCRRSGWVDPGGTVRVGPYRLRLVGGVRREDRPADPEPGEVAADPARPRLALELSHRSIRPSVCPVDDGLALVGSAADCQARLLDPSVSDYHCSLLQTPKGTWVVDLLGRGGVSINGTSTRLGRVYEGDELRVGDSSARLRSGAPGAEEVGPAWGMPAHPEAGPGPDTPANPSRLPALVSAADLRPLLSGLSPEKAGIAESFLVPLAHQFGLMQQQMLDRIHQAERERLQTFAAFQREQFGVLREELEQLRELRQELDELRGELRAQGHPSAAHDRSRVASVARPRLGSAAPVPPRAGTPAGTPALDPPESPMVLRMTVGEAS